MTLIRGTERPAVDRGPGLPTLQRLVDRANGSDAVTVLVNRFSDEQAVPEHTHDVEEVLLVMLGECVVDVDGQRLTARTGDAVVVSPGARHSIAHHTHGSCTVVGVLASPDVRIWSD